MGVMYPAPKFKVIDDDPGVVKALEHFRNSDWMLTAQTTAGFTVLGYFLGRRTYLHRPSAVAGGIIGVTFGVMYGLQNSMGRLMGLRENEEEQQKLAQA